jgi:hypothetical protein
MQYRGADKSLAWTDPAKNYSDRKFWVSYILFIILIGEIIVLCVYKYIIYIYIYNKKA